MPVIDHDAIYSYGKSILTDIDPSVVMGEDCRVWSFAVIGPGVILGSGCIIGSGCYIGRGSVLGDEVHLNHGVFLPNHSRVGNRVFIGPNATFTDDKHPRVNNPGYIAEPPVIEDDANIGAGAVILPGVRLGKGCTVGAGAVVTRDVPAGETWAGMPARRLQKWPELPPGGGWFRRQQQERSR